MSIVINRLRDCPTCGGLMEITKFTEKNIHSGKPIVVFVGYCKKGLSGCEFLEMDLDVQDWDTAVEVLNREVERRYFQIYGIYRN